MKLLISCCNENGGLFLTDTHTEQTARLTPKHYTSGRTGLTRNGDIIYSAGPSDIYSYKWENNSLTTLDHWSGFKDWDIHDIKYHREHLYIVQTGGNCVAKIPTSGEQSLEIVWRLYDQDDMDIVHVNSLLVGLDFLIASRFTPDSQKRPWKKVAGEGDIQLFTLTSERITNIAAGLSHPHSLCQDSGGKLHYIESYTQTLAAKPLKGEARKIVELPGYPRGLLITDTHYYTGNSKTTNHQGINFKVDRPSIVEISKKTLQKTREFIIEDAIEIYDVIELPEIS